MSRVMNSSIYNKITSFRKKLGFTLAEILITLGIIGVIAAISIPMLVIKTQKTIVETKLKHFYAEINNAFRLAASENGMDINGWVDRQHNYGKTEMDIFIQLYVLPYMNVAYTKSVERNPRCPSSERVLIVLNNGTAFSVYVDTNGMDLFFHPDPEKYTYNNPRESFAFQNTKIRQERAFDNYNSLDFVEPYVMNWNGTMNMLKNDGHRGCNRTSENKQYCTKYIEMNNWKIPWDYPW